MNAFVPPFFGLTALALVARPLHAAEVISSAPQSLARTHVAQILLSAAAVAEPDRLAEPCRAKLRFVDDNGATIIGGDGREIAARLSVAPGQTRALLLPAGAAFASGTQKTRAIFRAELEFEEPVSAEGIDPCEGALASVEAYDARSGEGLRLQMVMDRKMKFLTVLSNLAKKTQDTVQSILDNLK